MLSWELSGSEAGQPRGGAPGQCPTAHVWQEQLWGEFQAQSTPMQVVGDPTLTESLPRLTRPRACHLPSRLIPTSTELQSAGAGGQLTPTWVKGPGHSHVASE